MLRRGNLRLLKIARKLNLILIFETYIKNIENILDFRKYFRMFSGSGLP